MTSTHIAILAMMAAWFLTSDAIALEQTSKVYRCEKAGRVEYSDTPCLNAREIDVTPTKGAETYPGANVRSPAAMREKSRDIVVEATRPLTGLDRKGFDTFERRSRLSAAAQQECRRLDQSLPALEKRDLQAKGDDKIAAAQSLYLARLQFKDLGC